MVPTSTCYFSSSCALLCPWCARDPRRDEKAEQKAAAWDAWLDCNESAEIARLIGRDDQTVTAGTEKTRSDPAFLSPPASRQHFDVWSFGADGTDSGHFGKMPPAVVRTCCGCSSVGNRWHAEGTPWAGSLAPWHLKFSPLSITK